MTDILSGGGVRARPPKIPPLFSWASSDHDVTTWNLSQINQHGKLCQKWAMTDILSGGGGGCPSQTPKIPPLFSWASSAHDVQFQDISKQQISLFLAFSFKIYCDIKVFWKIYCDIEILRQLEPWYGKLIKSFTLHHKVFHFASGKWLKHKSLCSNSFICGGIVASQFARVALDWCENTLSYNTISKCKASNSITMIERMLNAG